MSARLISLADPEEWRTALRRMAHGPAHTHWYNAALAASIQHEIVLFEYAEGEDSAACPIALRNVGQAVDIATPYGFSGFATRGRCTGLPDAFRRFAIDQRWVCGYLALHPLFPHPFGVPDGLALGRTVFLLDLSRSADALLASLHQTHRYEVRKDAGLLDSIVMEPAALSEALPALYAQTVLRTGPSDTYRFTEATLEAWLASPGCLVLGLGDPPQGLVLCLYTEDVADYFINASTMRGRRYTRILLWAAVRELQRRGVRYFNLGGGVRPADPLEAFKRRFGGDPMSVPELRQVYVPEVFEQLCRAAGVPARADFFPPFRSS